MCNEPAGFVTEVCNEVCNECPPRLCYRPLKKIRCHVGVSFFEVTPFWWFYRNIRRTTTNLRGGPPKTGNEPGDSLKGNHGGWRTRVMPSFPVEGQQEKRRATDVGILCAMCQGMHQPASGGAAPCRASRRKRSPGREACAARKVNCFRVFSPKNTGVLTRANMGVSIAVLFGK